MTTRYALSFLMLLFSSAAMANNVQISNVSIVTPSANTFQVQFDITWDNSWRVNSGSTNYDGVWVFFKYRATATPTQTYNTIPLTATNNVIPAGFDVFQNNVGTTKVGAMLYREPTNTGIGTVTLTGVRLGISSTLPYGVDVKSFAVEMVNIPALPNIAFPFQLGDGNGSTESLNAFHNIDNNQMNITNPAKCDVNANDDAELETNGITIGVNDTITFSNLTTQAFPTFKTFWCMKYELTQGAYRDFLNALSVTQQATRTSSSPSSAIGTGALINPSAFRNSIEVRTPGSSLPAVYGCDANNNNVYDEATDGEWVACNYLTWPDLASWLDWSGLAPMSEIQYEYICRGSTNAGAIFANVGEYAWGNNSLSATAYNMTSANTTTEAMSNAYTGTTGNATWGSNTLNFQGPVRNGIFAGAATTRFNSGSSFYGVMELSGNVYEYCITIGNVAGRSCKYVPNGDGAVNPNNANALFQSGTSFATWPGMDGNSTLSTPNFCASFCEITGNAGIMARGGSWANIGVSDLAVSYRLGNLTPLTRNERYGGRGVLLIR